VRDVAAGYEWSIIPRESWQCLEDWHFIVAATSRHWWPWWNYRFCIRYCAISAPPRSPSCASLHKLTASMQNWFQIPAVPPHLASHVDILCNFVKELFGRPIFKESILFVRRWFRARCAEWIQRWTWRWGWANWLFFMSFLGRECWRSWLFGRLAASILTSFYPRERRGEVLGINLCSKMVCHRCSLQIMVFGVVECC
jgi:hypothetical protein